MLVEKIYKETASISLTSQHPSFLFLQIPSSTMNFGAEPSHLPSSNDDDESFSHYLEELDEETTQWQKKDEIFASVYASNKEIMAYLSKEDERPKCIGSVPGHLVINRGREEGNNQLFNDYFSDNPTYGANLFRRRFQMQRSLFLRIVDRVREHDNFVQKVDGVGKPGMSTLQKVTAAFRTLVYGTSADGTDEYVRISESTVIACLKRFYRAIVEVYGDEYLRSPMVMMLQGCYKKAKNEVFQECWEV